MLRHLSLLALVVSLPLAAQPDISGDWSGTLDLSSARPGAPSLTIVMHIVSDDNGYAATLDSPDQGAFGLPVDEVTFESDTLTAALTNLGASFAGIVDSEGTEIDGQWTQGSVSLPLILTPYTEPDVMDEAAATEQKPAEIKRGDFSGDWLGIMEIDSGGQLRLTFQLHRNEDHSYNAVLNAPGQVDNLDLGQINVHGHDVMINIAGQASYTGVISQDEMTIEGTFEQGGTKNPMTLTRQ